MAALCVMSAIMFEGVALAQPATSSASSNAGVQKMEYDVYAGGFHVMAADLTVDAAKKKNYLLRLEGYTRGFLGKVANWKGVFETKGWYNPKTGSATPEKHLSRTDFTGEMELKEYFYNKDGTFREYRIKNEEEDGSAKPVEAELTSNTTDALTATLTTMNNVARKGKCEGSEEVFDGKRRYRREFVHKGEVELKGGEYNVYNGPAVECTVEVKPLAGKWHEKPRGWMSIQEQGRERGTMPTVWLAKVADGQPAIPVKIRVKTQYGTLFMHLTRYQGPQKTLQLAQQ